MVRSENNSKTFIKNENVYVVYENKTVTIVPLFSLAGQALFARCRDIGLTAVFGHDDPVVFAALKSIERSLLPSFT